MHTLVEHSSFIEHRNIKADLSSHSFRFFCKVGRRRNVPGAGLEGTSKVRSVCNLGTRFNCSGKPSGIVQP